MKVLSSCRRVAVSVVLCSWVSICGACHWVPPWNAEERFALIIAPAGDSSKHRSWIEGAAHCGRNWDLALVYYGTDTQFACPECAAVWRRRGVKWNLVHLFLKEHPKLLDYYRAVMILDDDIEISASELTTFFDLFVRADLNLVLAQPSLCPGSETAWWETVIQRDRMLLHYTSFVELMAPTALRGGANAN